MSHYDEPCSLYCDHTEGEHLAFDAGRAEGERNGRDTDCPYWEPAIRDAWQNGQSIGALNREALMAKPTPEELTRTQDDVRERCDSWDDIRRAITYDYLHALGMTLEKSKEIRRKAGLTQ